MYDLHIVKCNKKKNNFLFQSVSCMNCMPSNKFLVNCNIYFLEIRFKIITELSNTR